MLLLSVGPAELRADRRSRRLLRRGDRDDRQAPRLREGRPRPVRGEGLPPALGRAAPRLGFLRGDRGRPAALLPRREGGERRPNARLEAGGRVRRRPQEGPPGGRPLKPLARLWVGCDSF